MSTTSYRVYTKRKLTEDPQLAKGYTRKQKSSEDDDAVLRAKYIHKSEYELLDQVLDKNQPDAGKLI